MHIKRALAVLTISVASFSAYASPVLYSGNGHYYEVISFADPAVGRMDWNQAKAYAETLSYLGSNGHLATLTSQGEDDFVWRDLKAEGTFLGGYDHSTYSNGTWTHQEWKWVTGETFSHSNWINGEPNHWQDGSNLTPNNEDYLMYWWSKPNFGANERWNDTNVDSSWMSGSNLTYSTRGFVVEYEPTSGASLTTVPVPGALWLFAAGLGFLIRGKKAVA